MSDMVKLKMVKGKTFMCPPVFGSEKVINVGDVVDVPADKVEIILAESYKDASNNEHFLFVEEGSEADPAAKEAPKSRRRAAPAKSEK